MLFCNVRRIIIVLIINTLSRYSKQNIPTNEEFTRVDIELKIMWYLYRTPRMPGVG